MGKVIIITLALLLFAGVILASETEDAFDELVYAMQQIEAVTTDMLLWLGWGDPEKDTEHIKEASGQAVADLQEIRDRLGAMEVPAKLEKFKGLEDLVAEKLQVFYGGIEEKEEDVHKREWAEVGKPFAELTEEGARLLVEVYGKGKYLAESKDAEVSLISDKGDRKDYLKALELLESKKDGVGEKAYELLKPLREKYNGSPAEDCIELRISDCYLISDSFGAPDDFEGSPTEEGLKILSSILEKKRYSPVLYETFYKWRTVEQMFHYGMSNMGTIPNKEYNKKRWEMVQVVKKHLAENPDDKLAKDQWMNLLALENITRGDTYGNSNLMHWGIIYLDLSKEDEPRE
ncbi:hypothetical protein ACFLZ3_00495 [Candidatus Omnitrophota bacterium]